MQNRKNVFKIYIQKTDSLNKKYKQDNYGAIISEI